MTEAPALPESDVIPRVTAADVAFNYDRDGAPPIWPNPKRGAPNVLGVTIRLQPGDQLIAAVQQRMRELSVPDEPEDEESPEAASARREYETAAGRLNEARGLLADAEGKATAAAERVTELLRAGKEPKQAEADQRRAVQDQESFTRRVAILETPAQASWRAWEAIRRADAEAHRQTQAAELVEQYRAKREELVTLAVPVVLEMLALEGALTRHLGSQPAESS